MSNMVVRTNVFSLNSHRNLTNVGLNQRTAAQRLSSGFSINSAADDAAGLAISESMRAQIRGLDQASINAQDGIGLIQTAEGAMATVSEMVTRIRELLVQAANDTYTFGQRGMIQTEIDQLMTEINDVTFRTEFNTRTLLDGGLSGGGGNTSPVSLQWMLFQQVRVVGIAAPGGELQPNNRGSNSIRQDIINMQEELNELIERIANRQINAGILNRSDFDFDFSRLMSGDPLIDHTTTTSEGNINILQANGLTASETQELRSIANRLNNAVLAGVRAAQEIYQITGEQVRALGGVSASNNDGTDVFIEAAMDEWFVNLPNAWYEGAFNPLNNNTFTETDDGGLPGASASLFHIEQFTGNGTGTFNGQSEFDQVISNALSSAPNSLAGLNRGFRLLVGFENAAGARVPAQFVPVSPYSTPSGALAAATNALNAFNTTTGIVPPVAPPTTATLPFEVTALNALNALDAAIATPSMASIVFAYNSAIYARTAALSVLNAAIAARNNAVGDNFALAQVAVAAAQAAYNAMSNAFNAFTQTGPTLVSLLPPSNNTHAAAGLAAAIALQTALTNSRDAAQQAVDDELAGIPPVPVDVIPNHGFLSRLETLLDKGTGALATVNLESNAMWFQIGPNSMQGMVLQLKGMHTGILGGGRGDLALLIDVREESGIPISEQLEAIDRAEGIVNAQRAQLGAVQNRLEFTRQSLDISSENLSAAESRIRDTDMAREMMRFTQAQVLQQAGISMLAQANQLPSSILQLLQ